MTCFQVSLKISSYLIFWYLAFVFSNHSNCLYNIITKYCINNYCDWRTQMPSIRIWWKFERNLKASHLTIFQIRDGLEGTVTTRPDISYSVVKIWPQPLALRMRGGRAAHQSALWAPFSLNKSEAEVENGCGRMDILRVYLLRPRSCRQCVPWGQRPLIIVS